MSGNPVIAPSEAIVRQTALASFLVMSKFLATNMYMGYARANAGVRAPEDTKLGLGKQDFSTVVKPDAKADDERARRIVANDLENLPFGLIAAWASACFGASDQAHIYLLWAFVIGRSLHSLCYFYKEPYLRFVGFTAGVIGTMGMAVNTLAGVW